MTTAKLKPNPAEGHGLTPRVVDTIYAELSAGKPAGHVVAVVLLDPVEHGEKRTDGGTTRWVRFEAIRLEPVLDDHEAEQVRHLLTRAHDARHSGQTLPLDFGLRDDAEQRAFLLTALDDWAAENDVDLTESWWTYYDREHVAEPSKASTLQLREFALAKGAIAEQDGDASFVSDGAGRTEDEPDEDEDEPEDGASIIAFSDGKSAAANDKP